MSIPRKPTLARLSGKSCLRVAVSLVFLFAPLSVAAPSRAGQTGLATLGDGVSRTEIEVLKQRLNQGDVKAAYHLGMIYLNGDSRPTRADEAIAYFMMAAQKNHPGAQYQIGRYFKDNADLEGSRARAVKWLTLAANNGSVRARRDLAVLGIQTAESPMDTQVQPVVPKPAPTETTAKPADTDCLDATGIDDPDFRRNRQTFAKETDLCVSRETVTEHGLKWVFTVIVNTRAPKGPVWGLLHDNEQEAFDAALYAITQYGGKMVAVEADENRIFKGAQDPNRNFGLTVDQTRTCGEMRRKPAPQFTKAFLKHFTSGYPVLTLHNNRNGHAGNGGSGTISAKRSSRVMTGLMTRNPKGPLSDEDNAILLAGKTPYKASQALMDRIAYFHGKGVNVIYEHVRAGSNDCSLSNYILLNDGRDYFNIEVEHGQGEIQKAIVDILVSYLRKTN